MNKRYPMVVIGLGNPFRGDDACGLEVARGIRQQSYPGVRVVECMSDGTLMIEAWDGAELAIVADSIRSGAPAGEISRFEPMQKPLAENMFRSSTSHRIAVTQVLSLAYALERLPQRLILYCIEGSDFRYTARVTPAVADSVLVVQDLITKELVQISNRGTGC